MRVTLIELGNSHEECLYSQLLFLKKHNCDVTLIASSSLRKSLEQFDISSSLLLFEQPSKNKFTWRIIFKIRKLILKTSPDKVIFNTGQGVAVKKLLLLPFNRKIEFIGILHNLKKIKNSIGQKLISRKVKKYFILSEYLTNHIPNKIRMNIKFAVFYPIFFPKYPKEALVKAKNEIWVCVPGQVELKRRDYESLIEALTITNINPNIKFILLGRSAHYQGDGKKLKNRINELGLNDQFKLWDNFIDDSTYHNYIEKSDYILPLIHQSTKSSELYKYQISGAFNLAIGYKKPLLMETRYDNYVEFRKNSIFYDKQDIVDTLNNLGKYKKNEFYNDEIWNFKFQCQQYWNLLML